MKIFISHCSSDTPLIKEHMGVFVSNKKDKIFFSSSPETGVESGGEIMNTLNKKIQECDTFVCIVTENYIRSAFCMYELNVATFLSTKKRTIIPIIINDGAYQRIKSTIEHLNLLYLNASNKDDFVYRFTSLFQKADKEEVELFREKLVLANTSERSYIGMEEAFFKNVISYCQKHHITAMNNAFEDGQTLVNKVKKAKEVYILSTTGSALIKRLSTEAFIDALCNGVKIHIIVPNQYSNFLYNVAQLERPNDPYSRFEEINHEYEAAMGYLCEAYSKAKTISSEIGTIDYYCSYNMLRQTIVLVKGEDDVFCSMSLTIPPKKTIDGTPTIVIDSAYEDSSLASILEEHCLAIMKTAVANRSHFSIDENFKAKPFFLEKESAKIYWNEKYNIALNNMKTQKGNSDDVLIEVAAQHPLEKDGSPRKEFKLRLDKGFDLYQKLKNSGKTVKIYVPGSIHQLNGRIDPVSLSSSGKKYLLGLGVKKDNIYADEMNIKYKGDDGVYNSADECFVTSKIFFDENFGELISVCSPNQLLRKTLFYIEFGVLANCYSAPSDEMYHNVISELFTNIDYVLYKDHNGQDKDSEMFISSRAERKPR